VRTTIRGRNLTVTDKDGAYIERKLRRLDRVLDDRSEVDVELRLEGNGKVSDSHVVDVSLLIDGRRLRGNAAGPTFRAAADLVVDRLERQTVELKERPLVRRHDETVRHGATLAGMPPTTGAASADQAGPEDGAEADDIRVVKVKRFAIEPMFEEDAISRMEELGHTFFIFVNAENERVAVLYRRRDGRYGLIEPVIGGSYAATG
jgi:putative sigma-54 modulation protein